MVMAQWFMSLLESVGLRFSSAHGAGSCDDSLFCPSCSKATADDDEDSLQSERYRYLDQVRDIPVAVLECEKHSTGCSSSGSSSSISSMASGFCPPHLTDGSCSTVLECQAPALRELACRMASDGFTRALIKAFAREPAGVLERWFYELDVNEALRINVLEDNDGALQLPDDGDLLVRRRRSLSNWTRGLILMSEALSATQTQHHLGLRLAWFAEASISKMLGFADFLAAVELEHESPTESLWALLNLHVHVSRAYEIIMPSLMEECRSVGSLETKRLVNKLDKDFVWRKDKLGEAIWGMVQEFEATISSRDSWDIIPFDGEVHETTELTLQYLAMLWANSRVLNSIVLCFSESWHQTSTVDMVAAMVHALERQLEEESKSLPNPSLRYIFLLNNFDFIQERLDGFLFAPKQMVIGIRRKLETYLKSYLDISWEPVLSCLQRNGATASWLLIQKRCHPQEKFLSMLEATCSAQKLWKVPNPTLRRRLREAITKKVVGAYGDYLPSSSSNASDLQLKDTLNELFEG